jgi:D-glycero-D-manno-heptose 1,7-bisphosphate phosphatase
MSSGVIFLKKKIVKKIKKNFHSLEDQILTNSIRKKLVGGTLVNSFFIDIGTPDNYNYAKSNLAKFLTKKSIFLDRDGVINRDFGYVCDIKNFKLNNGVVKSLKYLINKNYYIFVITNQAGIAKQKFSFDKYIKFSQEIKNFFLKKNILFNDVQFCPYHPKATIKKFKKKTIFRKPGNGMIEKIMKNFYIDRRSSVMIGDQVTDFLAAKKSGLRFFYYKKNLFNLVKKVAR